MPEVKKNKEGYKKSVRHTLHIVFSGIFGVCLIVSAGGREIIQRDARYSREERSGIHIARCVFCQCCFDVGVPFFFLYIFCLGHKNKMWPPRERWEIVASRCAS